ncbi:MAG TPA: hypothetical protein VF454_00180 [Gemmatimonadales bacterium]
MVVQTHGVTVGWRVITVEKVNGGILAHDNLQILEANQTLTEISIDERGRLRYVRQGGTLAGVPVRTSLTYSRNRVRGVAIVADTSGARTVESDMAIPTGTIDDLSISLFLPALPWAEGAVWHFPNYVADAAYLQSLTLTVVGQATISLRSGPVDAWQGILTGGAARTVVYVSRAQPYRLLRIEFPEVDLTFQLAD